MKSIVLSAVCLFFIPACKKNGGASREKEILLAEIKINGLISNRFTYNSENLVSKIESYKNDINDNSLQAYVVWEYGDNKQIKFYTAYALPNHIPAQKVVFKYDSLDQLVSAEEYNLLGPTPHQSFSTLQFTYNAKGRVIKKLTRNKDGEATNQTNYSYYDDGHLKTIEGWSAKDGVLWLSSRTSFSSPGNFFPFGLGDVAIVIGPEFLGGLQSETLNYRSFDKNGGIITEFSEIMSAREMNDNGSLARQVVTRKYVKPQKDDASEVLEFDYIIQ